MAQSKQNILVHGFSGSIDKLLTFSLRAGKTFVRGFKRKEAERTEPQLAFKEKFLAATRYGARAMKNAALKAFYEGLKKDGQSAYNIAFRDALKSPEVRLLNTAAYNGLPGSKIIVEASDDCTVDKVTVLIHDNQGVLVESGDSSLDEDEFQWTYLATGYNTMPAGSKITATAYDLPGNTGSLEVTL